MRQALQMATRAAETDEGHSRLLKCALVIDESRAYWSHIDSKKRDAGDSRTDSQVAFEEYWFGARSEKWVKEIILNMRMRYAAFPTALSVLTRWSSMSPEIRQVICHWHCQLADLHYRKFTGEYLVQRRDALRPELHRQGVITWVTENVSSTWKVETRTRMASNLLSTAHAAGLVKGKRDPRQLVYPRIPDQALGYILHLLREIDFNGSLAENSYLASVGLQGMLADRLRSLDCVTYRRVGDMHNFDWRYPDLQAWAKAELLGACA